MNKYIMGILITVAGTLVLAVAQLILKKASGRDWGSHIREYLNFPVIFAYGLSFTAVFATVYAMKFIPVAVYAAISGSGQVFVPLLSRIFLKEKMSVRKWIGVLVIVIGIVVVSL